MRKRKLLKFYEDGYHLCEVIIPECDQLEDLDYTVDAVMEWRDPKSNRVYQKKIEFDPRKDISKMKFNKNNPLF